MARTLVAWGPAAAWAVVIFVLSSQPDLGPAPFPHADKVVHVGLYAILGATLAWGARGSGVAGRWRWVLLGVVYGASDEWHQSFVSGRDPSLGDLAADTVGVALGVHLLLLLTARTRARGRTEICGT